MADSGSRRRHRGRHRSRGLRPLPRSARLAAAGLRAPRLPHRRGGGALPGRARARGRGPPRRPGLLGRCRGLRHGLAALRAAGRSGRRTPMARHRACGGARHQRAPGRRGARRRAHRPRFLRHLALRPADALARDRAQAPGRRRGRLRGGALQPRVAETPQPARGGPEYPRRQSAARLPRGRCPQSRAGGRARHRHHPGRPRSRRGRHAHRRRRGQQPDPARGAWRPGVALHAARLRTGRADATEDRSAPRAAESA